MRNVIIVQHFPLHCHNKRRAHQRGEFFKVTSAQQNEFIVTNFKFHVSVRLCGCRRSSVKFDIAAIKMQQTRRRWWCIILLHPRFATERWTAAH